MKKMELNEDCIERIIKFSNKVTVGNLMLCSKRTFQISKEVCEFHKFHHDYSVAVRRYQNNVKKPEKKKRQLYKIVDILTGNQNHWRILYDRGKKYEDYCRTMHNNLWKFIHLDFVHPKKKRRCVTKMRKWKDEMLRKDTIINNLRF